MLATVLLALVVFASISATNGTGSGTALAQAAEPSDRDALVREMEESKAALEKARSREQRIQSTLSTLAAERERINIDLMGKAREIQDIESQMTAIEARLGELQVREKIIRGSLTQQNARIARLLAAMQRMGRNPPPVIVTRRKDALAMVRSAMLLAKAFPELRVEATRLGQQLDALVEVKSQIMSQKSNLQSRSVALAAAQSQLKTAMDEKKQSLSLRQKELAAIRRDATRISQNVSNLSDLIARLDEAVSRNTDLGNYNRKLETARRVEARPETPQVADPSQTRDAAPAGKQDRMAREPVPGATNAPSVALVPGGGGWSPRADRLAPAIPFSQAKGKLPMPAAGQVVLTFGERTKLGRKSQGLVLETRTNAQITSPTDGWVVYAGPFRSYGQLLIINAGGGYHILLAGLARIDVQLGQFVLASEPIGTMGRAQSGESGAGKPVLYVEFRNGGKPIDPSPWWSKGQVVAQR